MLGFINTNWEILLTILFVALGFVFKNYLSWLYWFKVVTDTAWTEAERQGILQELTGNEKLILFRERFDRFYKDRYLKDPSDKVIEKAHSAAAELSLEDKVLRLASPK